MKTKTAEEIIQESGFNEKPAIHNYDLIELMESYADQWRRWVSFEERKPTKEDADFWGRVLWRYSDMTVVLRPWYAHEEDAKHWLPISEQEDKS